MTTNDIAIREGSTPEPYQPSTTPALRAGALDYPTMLQLGAAFAASGLFPGVKDQGVAVVKILAGAEMGLEPVSAMNGIDIIAMPNRPPRMRPNADVQALLARRAGYDFVPVEHTPEKCVLEWVYDGKVLGTSEFSIAQAQKARLVRDGGAWQAWPENMTLARAITQGVKLYCRHILAGSVGGMQIVTTDELEQEYPDPRDDLMRALFAAWNEKFPKEQGEDPERYRVFRLSWSEKILGREITSWNGPVAPETLTRADIQVLIDALQSSAGDPQETAAGTARLATPPAEHHTNPPSPRGQAAPPGEAQPSAAGQGSDLRRGQAPAEHQSEAPGGMEKGSSASGASAPTGVLGEDRSLPTERVGVPPARRKVSVKDEAQQTTAERTARKDKDPDPLHLMHPAFNRYFCDWFTNQNEATGVDDARRFATAQIAKWKAEGTWTGDYTMPQLEALAAATFERKETR